MATFSPTVEYSSKISPTVTEIVANLAAKQKNSTKWIRARFKRYSKRLPDEIYSLLSVHTFISTLRTTIMLLLIYCSDFLYRWNLY